MLKLDDQLCFALYTAANAVMRAYRPFLDDIELSYRQYLVMICLWQHGSSSPDQIANRLSIDRDVIDPVLGELETSGYVCLARGTVDREEAVVVLTPTGLQLEEAASEAQRQVVCRTGMTDHGMAALRQQLHGLIDRIAAPGPASRQKP